MTIAAAWFQARSDPPQSSEAAGRLLVPHNMMFDMIALGALKGAPLVILFVWLDAREQHLCVATLARWSNNRVWPVVV